MHDPDYSAGNGEDKIYLLVRNGRPPDNVRSPSNAMFSARDHVRRTNSPALVFNTWTNEIEYSSDNEYVGFTDAQKVAVDAVELELKTVKAQITKEKEALAKLKAEMKKLLTQARVEA